MKKKWTLEIQKWTFKTKKWILEVCFSEKAVISQ